MNKLVPENKDKEILVPLTGSMYVPGKFSDPEKVIVDIGTGYYIEKDTDSAKEYFGKKVKYVTEQMEKVQAIGNEKNKIREAVMDVMESKLQVQFAQQKAAEAKVLAEREKNERIKAAGERKILFYHANIISFYFHKNC